MTALISEQHYARVRTFKQLLSSFQRNRDLVSVGAYAKGSDPMLDKAIALWPQLEGYLQQGIFERADWEASLQGLERIFPTLKDLAEKEVEDAARLLGEMRRGCQQAEEQLKMLIDYQNEYRNNLNSDMSAGMTSNRWINYQQFIQTLEKAITQHRQQLNQWTHKVDIALNSWREKKQRLQAWQTLQERQSTAALLAENRLDQKKMDEFAQRAAMRKPE